MNDLFCFLLFWFFSSLNPLFQTLGLSFTVFFFYNPLAVSSSSTTSINFLLFLSLLVFKKGCSFKIEQAFIVAIYMLDIVMSE